MVNIVTSAKMLKVLSLVCLLMGTEAALADPIASLPDGSDAAWNELGFRSRAKFADPALNQPTKSLAAAALAAALAPTHNPGASAMQPKSELSVLAVRGYDQDGQRAMCRPQPRAFCAALATPAEDFASECRDAGAQVTVCGCHKYLCSQALR